MHGQIEPADCPVCKGTAYPVVTFSCPEHGPVIIAFKFRLDSEGEAEVAAVQFPGRGWELPPEEMKCPRCGRELLERSDDPLAGVDRTRK